MQQQQQQQQQQSNPKSVGFAAGDGGGRARPVTAPARAGSRLAAGAARVTAKPAATGVTTFKKKNYLLH
jgi:hypothetical protein